MDDQEHDHCHTCFRLYCNVVDACRMVPCESACGLRMHECKVSDHTIVCLKFKVPCSNAAYGCPATLPRENIKTHLTVCPASAIFCTMEWNRYPIYSKSRLNWVPFFQPNPVLVKGQLDVELAMRDQRLLGDVFKKRCRKGKAKVDILRLPNNRLSSPASSPTGNGFEKKHVETQVEIAVALSKLENKLRLKTYGNNGETNDGNGSFDSDNFIMKVKDEKHQIHTAMCEPQQEAESKSETFLQPQDPSRCCEAVLLSSGEYKENTGSQRTQQEPEGKSFDKTSQPIELLHSTNTARTKLNNSQECISILPTLDNKNDYSQDSDNSPVNETDKASLPTPPEFHPIYLAEPLGLNVMIETLPKFQKQTPLYSIPCNQVFRRDEYGEHFRNVHSEIHGGLNGWLEQRCPLAQYGCTYVRYRLHPDTQCGHIVFNQDLGNFGIRPCMNSNSLNGTKKSQCPHRASEKTTANLLCQLPIEIIAAIAEKLDGFSLCNLSRTCKLLREVCRSLLERKGVVLFEWEKRISDNGEWSWQVRQRKWFFSTSFAPVKAWVHSDSPSMTAHLETCRFYERHVPHKQFRYHSTKLPPHMDGFDDSCFLGSDMMDKHRGLRATAARERLDFNFEERIRELEDIAAGRDRSAHAHPLGDYNLEFVIQCNENYEALGVDSFAMAEAESPDSPKLALQHNTMMHEGDSPQGACASTTSLNSSKYEFDPCQAAAEITSAYLYMYSGEGSSTQRRLSDECDLPLVHVPHSGQCRLSGTQQAGLDITTEHFIGASKTHLPAAILDCQDSHELLGSQESANLSADAPQCDAPSNPINADEAAEAVANAYLYMYTGSHTGTAVEMYEDEHAGQSETLKPNSECWDFPASEANHEEDSEKDTSPYPQVCSVSNVHDPQEDAADENFPDVVAEQDEDDSSTDDENMSLSCAAESDASSDDTSESSTSMHIAPGRGADVCECP